MKRYKRVVPSVLAFSLTLSSLPTNDVFATTKTDFSDSITEMDITDNPEDVVFEDLTTGSAIEIAPLPTETIETTGVLTNANINTRASNTVEKNGWTFEYDDTSEIHTAKITATLMKV